MISTNPARTEETVAEVLLGDAGTFVEACRAAREAQRGWAAVPAPIRSQVVKKIGRVVENNKEALARLVTREIGKPYAESLRSEEHTSELQSRQYLVCRLLLEKKKPPPSTVYVHAPLIPQLT